MHDSIHATKIDSFVCNDSLAIIVETNPCPFILVIIIIIHSFAAHVYEFI